VSRIKLCLQKEQKYESQCSQCSQFPSFALDCRPIRALSSLQSLCSLRWSTQPHLPLSDTASIFGGAFTGATGDASTSSSSAIGDFVGWHEVQTIGAPPSGRFDAAYADQSAASAAISASLTAGGALAWSTLGNANGRVNGSTMELQSHLTLRLDAFATLIALWPQLTLRASLECAADAQFASTVANAGYGATASALASASVVNASSFAAAGIAAWPRVRADASLRIVFTPLSSPGGGSGSGSGAGSVASSGWVSVSPSAGVAYQTAFTLSAVGWTESVDGRSSSSSPSPTLRFQFFVRTASVSDASVRGLAASALNISAITAAYAQSAAIGAAAWPFPLFPAAPSLSSLGGLSVSTLSRVVNASIATRAAVAAGSFVRMALAPASSSPLLVGVALPPGDTVLVELCVWSSESSASDRTDAAQCVMAAPIAVADPNANANAAIAAANIVTGSGSVSGSAVSSSYAPLTAVDILASTVASVDEWNRTCQVDRLLQALVGIAAPLNALSPPLLTLAAPLLLGSGALNPTVAASLAWSITSVSSSSSSSSSVSSASLSSPPADAVVMLAARKRALAALTAAAVDANAQLQCRVAHAVAAVNAANASTSAVSALLSSSTTIAGAVPTLTVPTSVTEAAAVAAAAASSSLDLPLTLQMLRSLTAPALHLDASAAEAALDTLQALSDGGWAWRAGATAVNLAAYSAAGSGSVAAAESVTAAAAASAWACFAWPTGAPLMANNATANATSSCAFALPPSMNAPSLLNAHLLASSASSSSFLEALAVLRAAFGVLENIGRALPAFAHVPVAASTATDAALRPGGARTLALDLGPMYAAGGGQAAVAARIAATAALPLQSSLLSSAAPLVEFARAATAHARAAAESATLGLVSAAAAMTNSGGSALSANATAAAFYYPSLFAEHSSSSSHESSRQASELQSSSSASWWAALAPLRLDIAKCPLPPLQPPAPPALPSALSLRQSRVLLRMLRTLAPLWSAALTHRALLSRAGDRLAGWDAATVAGGSNAGNALTASGSEWAAAAVRVWDAPTFGSVSPTFWVPADVQTAAHARLASAAAPSSILTPAFLAAYWNVSVDPAATAAASSVRAALTARQPDGPASRRLPAHIGIRYGSRGNEVDNGIQTAAKMVIISTNKKFCFKYQICFDCIFKKRLRSTFLNSCFIFERPFILSSDSHPIVGPHQPAAAIHRARRPARALVAAAVRLVARRRTKPRAGH
jgi:hypothetical protein